MRFITGAAFAAILAVPPAATLAQGLKDAPTIEQQLMPQLGQPLGGGTRGVGLARKPPAGAAAPVEPAAAPGAQPAPPSATPPTAAQHPPAPHPARSQEAAAQPAIAASDLIVLFANGSADLAPEGLAQLAELARALSGEALSAYKFRIEGYTDTVGSADYNRQLSERRAAAVVDYLVGTGHVSADRLQSVGFGKTRLLVPTPDQTPEPRNRRVRVVNIGS